MQPRNDGKPAPKGPRVPEKGAKPKLRIVKLESRIAPKLAANHNETLVRDRV